MTSKTLVVGTIAVVMAGIAFWPSPPRSPEVVDIVADLKNGGPKHFSLGMAEYPNETPTAQMVLKDDRSGWSCMKWFELAMELEDHGYQWKVSNLQYQMEALNQNETTKEVIARCQRDEPFLVMIKDQRNNIFINMP